MRKPRKKTRTKKNTKLKDTKNTTNEILQETEKTKKKNQEFLMVGKCQEAYELWEKAYSDPPHQLWRKVSHTFSRYDHLSTETSLEAA